MCCAGGSRSQRSSDGGIKKWRTGVSPLSLEQTTEEASAGVFESVSVEDNGETEDDPFHLMPPPLSPLDLEVLDDELSSSRKDIQGIV